MESILNDEDFKIFRDYIYDASGINFCDSNRSVLETRLRDLLRENGLKTVKEYYNLVYKNELETKKLLDAVTTNLTRFFRNTGHFDAFKKDIIPQLIKHKYKTGDFVFRCWSAGCSTGEECYSVAIVLREMLPSNFIIKVIGSDLSLKSLMKAKSGRYEATKLDGIEPEYLDKYFKKDGDFYVVEESIKKIVHFDYHNLNNKTTLAGNDVVFCRNVLIYFDEIIQAKVVNKIWDTMNPFSFFFIGHSESLFGMKTKFEFLKTDSACLYKKNVEKLEYGK